MIFLRRFCVTQITVKRGCSSDPIMRSLQKNTIPTLYGDEASPPVRFVMMTASLLGIKLKFHEIDLFSGQNKSDFYTRINPLQKVPALDTGERVICDSHAIALYLCRGTPRQGLYPEDALLRARVDEMLFFNSSSLFPIDSSIFSDYFSGKTISSSQVEHWDKLMDYLDLQLKTHSWLAGDKGCLNDIQKVIQIVNTDLVHIQEWSKAFGLKVNPDKTQVMVVGGSQLISRIDWKSMPPVLFDGVNIPYSKVVKNLGIFMDSSLNWDKQIGEMTLCDLCCGSTVTSLQLLLPPSSRHVEVSKWIKKLEQVSFFEINSRGLKRLAEFVDKVKEVERS